MTLTDKQCKEIISWHDYYNKMNVLECPDVCPPPGLYKSRLNYNISEVQRDSRTQWFFDLVHDYLKGDYPNNSVNKGKFFYAHEFFTGAKFTKHRDKDRNDEWAEIVGASLNTGFEGGKLLTYSPDGELASNKGELYRMGSKTLHEVTEVTSGTRYSFVYFISSQELGLTKPVI